MEYILGLIVVGFACWLYGRNNPAKTEKYNVRNSTIHGCGHEIVYGCAVKKPIIKKKYGTIFYYILKDGKEVYHRKDGPAIEYANGSKEWYMNGLLHREDGPAIEYANGSKEWYINGKQIELK